ncbi:ATP/GTP-binding protein [Kitasatospora herbaricolor]|uniref:zeta toxin family protein n=1 Tax=Kitasatospora herbaricolor TaxID=68217 RepID=UPI00174B8BF5|nr:zeta toxin family protein [Kitasatospora herbaricolor]MDQ0305525.1 putative ABC-type ATPase [Kitasatospora herbaricolor]GGV47596.1 ATP/GTP-binding protein [Kitasatospora herbaricolor]
MGEGEAVPAMLSNEESREVLGQIIVAAGMEGAVRQGQPVVVFVAGQPGSGKTELGDLVQASLGARGGVVRIGSDLYKSAHPLYAAFLAEDPRTAGVKVRPDTRRWQAAVEAHARDSGLDAVVETALSDPDEARAAAGDWRRAGYRIEVAVLAVAEAWSQLGVLDRYLEQAHAAGGRYVSWENHDACAAALAATVAVVESEQLADRVTVLRRGAEVLYANDLLPGGGWLRPIGAAVALAAEHTRWWNARESAQFRLQLAAADRRCHAELLPADRALAVRRDAERAFALAEPVRRTAQRRREPPGVDYHRLSAAEHRWIFENLIVPDLGTIVARERPVAVFVMGQPGAGKSDVTSTVRKSMRAGASHLVGDEFKAAHPDYRQLLLNDPRGAGAAIRADYRAWFTAAEALVREQRGDVVIEMAPGSAEDLLHSAAAFHRAGYRVELVVLAVRGADSRQATALRYAKAQQRGVPARFTSAAGHDVCFRAVAEALQAAQGSAVVDSVMVVGRDGLAVVDPAGGGDSDAARALAAERARPYTEEEACRFLDIQRALRAALPQHRDELEEITALGRALMPVGVRPGSRTPARSGPRALPAAEVAGG